MTKNIIGYLSAFLVVFAYACLSFHWLKQSDVLFNGMNLLGGIGLAYRVWLDRNYSNFILELVFICIAIKSLILN